MTRLPKDFTRPPINTLPKDLRADKVKIALALSGGGYRAASFHLGILAYLHHIQLLPNLTRLSTVSGGTFTGVKFILSLIDKHPFSKFFHEFYTFLKTKNLVELGLKDLNQGTIQVPSGEKKLINSLANVYATTFLVDPDGTPYTFGKILNNNSIRVTEVAFNATEFRTGIAFRFQKTASKKAKIGNGNVSISKKDAANIRLADIVAASSCFPGGFEPLAFPQDFAWPGNKIPPTVIAAMAIKSNKIPEYTCLDPDVPTEPVIKNTLPLMDGGIYDNQGIDSLLLADGRENDGIPDLFIISDTDPTDEDLFSYPAKISSAGWLTLEHINWLISIFLITCFLTVISIVGGIWREIAQGTFGFWKDFFSTLMPLLLSILVPVTILFGRSLIRRSLKYIPKLGIMSWQEIKTLKVNQFIYLMSLRVESLYALISKVFMKRIRSLIFQKVYKDKEYNNKRITNRIDRLIARTVKDVPGVEHPEHRLRLVIKKAACMPTTLWFNNKESLEIKTASGEKKKVCELDALIIAGQATLCFNLIQYIFRVYGENSSNYPPKILELWNDLHQELKKFNENPCWLVEKLELDMLRELKV